MESEQHVNAVTSSSSNSLRQGDSIFHPRYGFGTIHSLTRRDRTQPLREPTLADAASDRTEDYYDIHLVQGGTLLVPVNQAEGAGLRPLTNGLEAVKAGLRSQAERLPAGFRERAAVLRMREQLPAPGALTHAVRDMLGQAHGKALSNGEKAWLEKSCQRLSTEAALVDHISMFDARAAIWQVITQLSAV